MKLKTWGQFVLIIGSILLLSIHVDFYQVTTNNSNIRMTKLVSTWTMTGYLKCDFGVNGSFSFGFKARCPTTWNSTIPVPFEYFYNVQDETTSRTTFFRLTFEIILFDPSGDPIYSGQKVIRSGKNVGYQFLDSFIQQTSWALAANVTGIPSSTSWDGLVYMNATVSYGGIAYSNTSNSIEITYHHFSHRIPGFLVGSVILGVLCVTLLNTLIRRQNN